jgi:hypothetical protein
MSLAQEKINENGKPTFTMEEERDIALDFPQYFMLQQFPFAFTFRFYLYVFPPYAKLTLDFWKTFSKKVDHSKKVSRANKCLRRDIYGLDYLV